MPSYELMLLLRIMPKVEVVSTLKRTADAIFEKGGVIRKLENLGTKPIPYKTSSHGLVHTKASYFLFEFDSPPNTIDDLYEYYGRDIDIIRRRVYKLPNTFEEPVQECTLHDEILPPAYRKSVQDMIAEGQRQAKKSNFQYNSDLKYYPFQK